MIKSVRWVTIGAIFLLPLLPFVVVNGFFFPFITGKNFAFRILVEIAFAGWILLALADAKYRPRFSWTAVLFGVFVLWMAIADAIGMNPAKAFWSNFERMDGWVTLIHLFMLFLVMSSICRVDALWRKWWLTFLGVAALVCVYGLFQVSGVFAIHQGGVRLDATFGNSDYLAVYMLFAIAVSIWQAFEAKQAWLKYLLVLLTVFEIVILFLTATRGAILGFIGAVIFGALLWAIESGKKGRRSAIAVLLVLIVLAGGFFMVRTTPFVQHDPTLGRLATISLKDAETHARLSIWYMAVEGFVQKPIAGWGQEGFNYVFNKYYDPALYGQEPWFDRAHNMYLDWLLAGGAPALLLFLGFMASAALALYRSTVSRPERLLLLSALAAYAFQGFFVFDNLFSYIPLVVILAMAHSLSSRPIARLENAAVLPEADLGMIGLPIAGVVLVLVLWMVNVPSLRAAADLIAAITPGSDPTQNIAAFKQAYGDGSFADQEITEQLTTFAETSIGNQSIPVADRQAIFTYAAQQTQALVNRVPNDARIRLQFALLLRAGNDFPDALTQIHAAEQLSPKKQSLLIEEGLEDWESGNTAAAHAAFDKAYSLAPDATDLATYAAVGDIITGQPAVGKALLMKVFGTTIVDNEALMLAYYQTKDFPDLIALWQMRVVNQHHSASAEFGLVSAFASAGHYAEARAEIQTAVNEHPEVAQQGATLLTELNKLSPK
jgi:O-antigen ligase